MSFSVKKIASLYVSTALGELVLSAKSGEDPEIKMLVDEIEDTDDAMTNDGQLILNVVPSRAYIQQVYAYSDADVPKIKSAAIQAKAGNNAEAPANAVMTDGSIYSNKGVFVGPIVYNGTGTIELKFSSAEDWILI